MAKMSKRLRHEITTMSQRLGEVIEVLSSDNVQGIARRKDNWLNGADYKIVNPDCCESMRVAPSIEVFSISGSKMVFLWTIKKQMDTLLEDNVPTNKLINS